MLYLGSRWSNYSAISREFTDNKTRFFSKLVWKSRVFIMTPTLWSGGRLVGILKSGDFYSMLALKTEQTWRRILYIYIYFLHSTINNVQELFQQLGGGVSESKKPGLVEEVTLQRFTTVRKAASSEMTHVPMSGLAFQNKTTTLCSRMNYQSIEKYPTDI